MLVALALVLGGIVGVLWAFGAEYADRVRREDEGEYREFRGLVQQVRARVSGRPSQEQVGIEVAGTRIEGVLPNLFREGLATVTFSSSFEPRLLPLWVQHLVATVALDSYPGTAVLVSRAEKAPAISLAPVRREQARALLEDLVALYRMGRTVPLPLFPRTSYAYALAGGPANREQALEEARKAWGQDSGEAQDAFVRFAFGEVVSPEEVRAPGDHDFEGLAERVFRPVLDAMGE